MMHQKEIFLPYKIIEEPGEGEYEEKKSRFIAKIVPAASEEEAVAFIDLVKKKYYDARHHCPALIIGRNREVTRCSDDGEPGGTAGKPILEVMLGAEITNAVMVVTRYFGGTLLGTGGLVRAYQQAVQEGLRNSIIIEKQPGRTLKIDTDYNGIGKIQYILAQQEISVINTVYTNKVEIEAMVPLGKLEALQEAVTEGTNGNAGFWLGEVVDFACIDGKIKKF